MNKYSLSGASWSVSTTIIRRTARSAPAVTATAWSSATAVSVVVIVSWITRWATLFWLHLTGSCRNNNKLHLTSNLQTTHKRVYDEEITSYSFCLLEQTESRSAVHRPTFYPGYAGRLLRLAHPQTCSAVKALLFKETLTSRKTRKPKETPYTNIHQWFKKKTLGVIVMIGKRGNYVWWNHSEMMK